MKMNRAKWIWYPGDYEIYHHLLLSCRRQEFGCDYPCAWRVVSPEKTVTFVRDFEAEKPFSLTVHSHSKGRVILPCGTFPVNTPISAPAGKYRIEVCLFDLEAFPSLFIDSECLVTDENWTCEARDTRWFGASCEPAYYKAGDDPRVFPFCYRPVEICGEKETNGGVLYDFGKETFGPVTVENRANPAGVTLVYGESVEEALDEKWAIIRETLTESDGNVRPARAFRYIFARAADGKKVNLSAQYEYLPLEDRASFRCGNEEIEKIWDLCAYTFHLNSREFFLDGIKRDRWVWSGDAYQSFMINRCLFADNALTERTITALLGRPPYNMHINRINDYSAYLIIAALEHYEATGRIDFIRGIWENLKALFSFIVSRLDENGLSVPRPGDWVFIDWGVLDKDGPHCAEQILLWKTYGAMTGLSAAVGENGDYTEKADALRKLINEKYWSPEKGAFIDSFTSGRSFVSRQTNVHAVLFGFADEKQTADIVSNVFDNPGLPAITTPYFKLYELLALCRCGRIETAQNYILSYWGGMLKEGATSVWEEYDPEKHGAEHYAMYGTPYAKSLCHAWGSGPILLLIGETMGIKSTSAGGKTFTVEPKPGIFKSFTSRAPIGAGIAEIVYDNGKISARATVPGGTLLWNGRKTEIEVQQFE